LSRRAWLRMRNLFDGRSSEAACPVAKRPSHRLRQGFFIALVLDPDSKANARIYSARSVQQRFIFARALCSDGGCDITARSVERTRGQVLSAIIRPAIGIQD